VASCLAGDVSRWKPGESCPERVATAAAVARFEGEPRRTRESDKRRYFFVRPVMNFLMEAMENRKIVLILGRLHSYYLDENERIAKGLRRSDG